MFGLGPKTALPTPETALRGRDTPMPVPLPHAVNGRKLDGPYPEGLEVAEVGLGCFWGAEKAFWSLPGVWVTAVGYAAGFTPNPTYEEVCSGRTGHAETVRVVFEPEVLAYEAVLRAFFEAHDPTQGMRQGGDVGSQYRSVILVHDAAQRATAEQVKANYGKALAEAGHGAVTTAIVDAGPFYFAEDYHQQYLAKNPNGYCGHGGTGVVCPVGLGSAAYPAVAGPAAIPCSSDRASGLPGLNTSARSASSRAAPSSPRSRAMCARNR